MLAIIGFVLGLVVVSGVLFVIGAVVFGRGEELAPPPRDSTPVVLPADRIPDAEDVEALRLSVVLRGYRMHEVDWVLDQLGEALREKDAQISALTNQLTQQPGGEPLVSVPARFEDDLRDDDFEDGFEDERDDVFEGDVNEPTRPVLVESTVEPRDVRG